MQTKDYIEGITGEFTLEMHDAEGNLINRWEERNLVVEIGRQNLARLLGAVQTNRHITKIGFGTSGSAAVAGDTALTDAFVKNIGSVSYPSATSVEFAWNLSTLEANGKEIREFGLLTLGDVLFARKSRDVITKSADFSLSGTWRIIF